MKKYRLLLSIFATIVLVGCIDRDFDLSKASGEITLGGENLTLPLATIDKMVLEDLLSEQEGITTDENGLFSIIFSSFGEDPTKYDSFSIEGVEIPPITDLSPNINPITFTMPEIPSTLNLGAVQKDLPIEYPAIGDAVEVASINLVQDLSFGLPLTGVGELSEAVAAAIPTIQLQHENSANFNAEITILEGFKFIDFVEFGCDIHPNGAPIEMVLDMNGLTDINGGGTLNLNVAFPEGYYLRDENGIDLPEERHNILSKSITIDAKQRKVKILAHLNRIDYSDMELSEGVLTINDKINYNFSLDLNVAAGTYDMSAKPNFSFVAAPKYKDVEVVISHFEVGDISAPLTYSFNGLNNSISIEKIAFSEAPMRISVTGLEWLDVDVSIRLDLPSALHFSDLGGASMVNNEDNVIVTTIRQLEQGLTLNLNYVDCTDASCKQENGQIVISDEIAASIDLSALDGETIMLSRLTPTTPSVTIGIHIDETPLSIDKANSVVKTTAENTFDFNLEEQLPSLSQTIEVPSLISSIDEVAICKAGSDEPMALSFSVATSGASFPVQTLDINLTVNLGKLLRPTQATLDSGLVKESESGDYILVVDREWDTSTTLSERLEFEALANLPNIVDGKMTLQQSFPVAGSVAIKSGEDIDLSATSAASVKIDMEIDDIEIKSFTGGLNIDLSPEPMVINLGDMSELGVDIGTMRLNPVLKFNLKENPSGVPFNAEAQLKLYDSSDNLLSTIATPSIPIAGEGATNIVLSTAKNRAKYDVEGVTFVEMNELTKLLEEGIPAKIVMDMNVSSEKERIYTINLADAKEGYLLEYQYEAIIPLSFDGALNLSYNNSITGLNETFAELASSTNGLTINDVTLLAEFGTTIPFDIVFSAEFINKEGTTEGIDAKLDIEECVIEGYTPEFGEKRTSDISLKFDLGENKSLQGLQNVDGIRFKFTLMNAGQESASLNKSQFLDGKLKMRLRDGISLDIFELLNNMTENVE